MTFREFGLAESLLRAVEAEGYTTPTPIQSASIPHLLAGRDLLGTAQTGTGKTAAFALPILHRLSATPPRRPARRGTVRALILSPTRELALQIGDSLRAYGHETGLRHTTVYGGVGQGPQARALRDGIDIVVATPGRLLDLEDQGLVDLTAIEILVLDEADRMLDMGFLPDVRRIVNQLPTQRQTMLFSATMPPAIAGLADSMLNHPARVEIAPVAATTKLVEQTVCFVEARDKSNVLAKFIKSRSIERALIFTRTKRGADRVVRLLDQSGIRSAAIHGNKSQNNRQRALDNFKSRRTPILIATDIAARGIDVEGISHVVNYELPHEPETYVHRIGRTGRAGALGVAVSFCDRAERKLLNAIERLTRVTLSTDASLPVDPQLNRSLPDAPTNPARPKAAGGHRRVRVRRGSGPNGRAGNRPRSRGARRSQFAS